MQAYAMWIGRPRHRAWLPVIKDGDFGRKIWRGGESFPRAEQAQAEAEAELARRDGAVR